MDKEATGVEDAEPMEYVCIQVAISIMAGHYPEPPRIYEQIGNDKAAELYKFDDDVYRMFLELRLYEETGDNFASLAASL